MPEGSVELATPIFWSPPMNHMPHDESSADRPSHGAESPVGAGNNDGDEADRLDVLIEKSLRGALTDTEQRELGAMLESSPELAAHAQQAQREDHTMQALIRHATEHFDPELARRAIEFEANSFRRTRWMLPTAVLGIFAFGVVYTLQRSNWSAVDWPLVIGLTLLAAIMWSATFWWMRFRARRAARVAAESVEALESTYQRKVRSIPKRILLYRILAIGAVVIMGLKLIEAMIAESGQIFWFIAFLLMLPNLYFAFDQRTIDRIAGVLSGVIDPDDATSSTNDRSNDTMPHD